MFIPNNALNKNLLELSKKADKTLIDNTLKKQKITIEDFAILISPNISSLQLKSLADKSYQETRRRFGFALSLYIPLYYDNRCTNGCIYCGFNALNKIERKNLTKTEIIKEAKIIRSQNFKSILLVAGEHPESSNIEFLIPIMQELHKINFSCVSIEIAPLETKDYKALVDKGHLDGLYVYQETYNKEIYKKVHKFGKKADYNFRLETPERGAEAGIQRIGIGFLMGLNDWREDALFMAQHMEYLQKYKWQTEYSFSFPRIRNAAGVNDDFFNVSDKEFFQLVCATRLLFPEAGMSLSTREYPKFRDKILPFGFTSLSAGSSTAPGGYSHKSKNLEQFEVEDNRSPNEIAKILNKYGFDPVWKDFE
jgi:2-iminoacetate synthase